MGNREPISQSQGTTASEQYLRRLSDRTFLALWRYPNLYAEPGKELCDLLVVFGTDVFVFSDKHVSFSTTGNLDVTWRRWFRRTIASGSRQVLGAERQIRSFPDQLFLDPRCTQRFPLSLPPMAAASFHLIVVAHGAGPACIASLGGTGSLMIDSSLQTAAAHTRPFVVGDLNPSGSFIHVLDDTTLEIVLKTRDTVSDFAHYLRKKEMFLRSLPVTAAGEEDLLAFYLKNMNPQQEHDFVVPADISAVGIDQGHWNAFQANPQRLAQVEADRISYVWDRLIDTFNFHALQGTQAFVDPPGINTTESIVRFMARESRTRRRLLGSSIVEMIETTPAHMVRTRVIRPSLPGDPHYAFVVFPVRDGVSDDDNRLVRRNYLEAVCMVTKLKYPDAQDIIGIATESGDRDSRSEDALYLDARVWTNEMAADAEEMQRNLKILTQPTELRSVVKEYPEASENK